MKSNNVLIFRYAYTLIIGMLLGFLVAQLTTSPSQNKYASMLRNKIEQQQKMIDGLMLELKAKS